MKTSRPRGMLLGVLALAAATACQDTPTQETPLPPAAQAEAIALSQQVLAVQARVAEAGDITPELYDELDRLEEAFLAWGERYDRDDIRVEHGSPMGSATTALTSAAAPRTETSPDGNTTCRCDEITAMAGQICFLVEIRDCQHGGWTCVYRCFYIWSLF